MNKVRNRILAAVVLILGLFSLSTVYADEKVVRILHVNDFHGFAEPFKPLGTHQLQGGAAYIASRINELRRERPSLLLAAGDMIQGNIWANLFQGESVIELMNAMKFDAMVVGNHEFDFGQAVLKKRISEAQFPILGANVQGIGKLKPYVVKEIEGIRVAVIGVVTDDTPETTHPANVEWLNFLPPADAIRKYIRELNGSADIIIVLSHLGLAADRLLAAQVKGIDVIVGGHSHTKIEKPVGIAKTVIVQAWEHGKALGVLDLTIEGGKVKKFEGRLEEIRPNATNRDNTVLSVVEKYEQKVDSVLNETVGEAELDLDGENVRKKETNLGNLVTDIVRNTVGAHAAIINGGDMRTSVKKGLIKAKHIYSVLPFDDYIVAIRLTGKQIAEALEHGVSAIEEGSGRFPQVSGITFTYSPQAKAGSRVREITIGQGPLEPNREYIVATNDFLAAGGDGYKVFGDALR
ncbi:MAG TPA: 5'-nucleotidase C-terminal domain-containing protein, partial [Thermodesulfovibrionales bacterium]|nr:5'-nucleotidase C-terminal domain-containing protein [Thermodesulfovibrionales bacterium]